MQFFHSFSFIWVLAICSSLWVCKALDCQLNESSNYKVAYTITVDQSGNGNFTTIQSAIDSIPDVNTRWIRIRISPETYREKVTIPVKKPCIFLQGEGSELTRIEWGDHGVTGTSATFTSYPENIVAKGITFKNTYNNPHGQAVSARIRGDKSAFYDCTFLGVQDTFWDEKGRHYFHKCYIEGAVDFIFGKGKSIYEKCIIFVNMGRYEPESPGYITAQKKEWAEHESGFVFKNCEINGTGKAYLGRAWGPYSTVVIHNSTFSDVVVPQGWDAWEYVNQEGNFTYVEVDNKGLGADTSNRVPWVKKLDATELSKFLSLSYVDSDGWLAKLPNIEE
ncbi:hypothetical protein MANES_05G013901v8 [Manihot esculenta]|uniref:Uncharacterized protein n=1 Tax=Manihot esculenta TaxID=3983 RepID=A0ACB7HKS5_MANES|nr:hypothetical protein MANES_05G013901v8 [Manihot esculenta]